MTHDRTPSNEPLDFDDYYSHEEDRAEMLINGVIAAGPLGMSRDAFRVLWQRVGYSANPEGYFRSKWGIGLFARHGDRVYATHIARAWMARAHATPID